MAHRKQRTELFVGLFVFFGLAIMGVLIVQFGRFSDRIKDTYELTVAFPDASGIRAGIPVRLGGAKVGSVAEDPYLAKDYLSMTIPLDIFSDYKIPLGSSFKIASVGMMGDKFISIEMPVKPVDDYIPEGAYISGVEAGGLDALQEDAAQISNDIKVVLQELLVTVKDVRVAVDQLDEFFVKATDGLLADENIENVKVMLADLKESSSNIKEATEKLDPIMVDAKVAVEKAGTTFDTATETIAKAGPGLEKLEPAVEELQSVLENANAAIAKLQSDDGTIGALVGDQELKEDLQNFVDKLDRYGILGYPKDKSRPEDEERSDRPPSAAPTSTDAAEIRGDAEGSGAEKRPWFRRRR